MLDPDDELRGPVVRHFPHAQPEIFGGDVTIANSQAGIDRLRGRWSLTHINADGQALEPDDAVCILEKERFLMIALDGTLMHKGIYLVEDSVCPKAITWVDTVGTDDMKLIPSIYRLTGDTLTIVVADEGQPRPTGFETGRGRTLRQFTRLPAPTHRFIQ